MNLKDLQEKRNQLAAEIKRQADDFDANGFDAEAEARFNEINKEYDETYSELVKTQEVESRAKLVDDHANETTNRVETREVGPTATVDTRNDSALAMQGWLLAGRGETLNDDQAAACQRMNLNPAQGEMSINLGQVRGESCWSVNGRNSIEKRAQTSGTDSEGGYTIPTGFANELEKRLLAFGGPRQVARILRTSDGRDITFPSLDDTSNSGALLAESGAAAEQDVTFASSTLSSYKYTSKYVKVSSELLRDSAFNLEVELAAILGERLGRAQAQSFTTGTGSSQPQGVTNCSAGVTAAAAGAIAADEIFDLQHSLDPAYRSDPSCGWMMHDSTLAAIRKLKDTTNQYLFQPGLSADSPDRLLGYPLTINNSMPEISTGNISLLFGAFNNFLIREVANLRLVRLEELYRINDQTGFVCFSSVDSRVLQTNAIKKLTQA